MNDLRAMTQALIQANDAVGEVIKRSMDYENIEGLSETRKCLIEVYVELSKQIRMFHQYSER